MIETTSPRSGEELYDDDFYTWTQNQAGLIRSGRLSAVDLINVAEEIESLGKSQLSALTSSYRLIAMHLLKFLVQPAKASMSWITTINRERGNIVLLLDDNPGMKPKRVERFAKAYAVARREAADETGVPLAKLPAAPPFDVDEVESRDFWPSAAKSLMSKNAARPTIDSARKGRAE